MHKFSVKKPMTVFVAIIAVLVLGVVAYLKMTPDLLPNMDFPYAIVVTAYPGATPEKVESEVTKPLEQAMSTLEHIKNVSSTSAENVSMLTLEFEEAANMDTIGVDIQQQITALSATWDEMVSTPYVLKINPSMLPVQVAALSMEGKDNLELTEFLNETLLNKLEGIPGVARISTTGMINQELHVVLDQKLLDETNQKVIDAINAELDKAAEDLEEQKAELEDSKEQMENAQGQMDAGVDAIIEGDKKLKEEKEKLLKAKEELEAGKQTLEVTYNTLKMLSDRVDEVVATQADTAQRLAQLEALQMQKEELQQMRLQIEETKAQIALLEASGNDPESLETLRTQLIQQEADLAMAEAAYNAALATAGTTDENLEQAVMTANLNAELADGAVSAIDALLETQDMSREGLKDAVTELKTQLDQLLEAEKQLEAGLLTMEEAEAMLEEQKLKGLVEMSSAAGQLAAGAASMEMALTQIESGLTTIEDSREDALRQADLNAIITMDMVKQILTAQNFAMPAGYVQENGISYMVSIGDEIEDLDTLQNLLLFDMGMEGVDPIYLKDVAVVMLTDNRDSTYAKLGGNDGVMLTFEKQSTYPTAEVTDNITEHFRELEKEYPGLKFVKLTDQGDYIYMVVESILKNLFLGALFSVLILFIFLRDIRPTFINLCSIPISVVFAIVLMYFSGVSLNMISLSGLAIAVGMLVDNSIVVIENIYRLRAKGANVIQAAVSGAGQVVGAIAASTLTTVCVFVPIIFVDGLTKQLFMDLALTMTYSLLASLIIALTLVPAMATTILKKDKPLREGNLGAKLMKAYRNSVQWTLNHKVIVLILSAVLLVASMVMSLSKGFIFMPTMDSPMITASVIMPEGADRETSVDLADTVLERVTELEGVETVGAMMDGGGSSYMSMGMGSLGSSATGQENYNVTVYVTLESEKISGAEVAKKIEESCADLSCSISATSAMMDMSMLTGSGVAVNLYSEDMDDLETAAKETAQLLERLEGVSEVSDGLEDTAPALHISIDRNEAMKHGLTVAQVYMELASGLTTDGTAASLELDGITTNVIIEKPDGAVLDGAELREYVFEVTNKDGDVEEIPLKDFAVVEETTSLQSISRVNQRRQLKVTAYLEEGYNVTLMTQQAEDIMKKADLPKGVSYAFTGENEMIMEAVEQLALMLLVGMVLVYLIMVAQFQSLKSPFIVMFTIPLAFTGGFLALLLCGMEVSIIALIGFIMLMGVIVNNGIVLVDYINQLRLEGMERREAIVEAGITRIRPILMTTLTTVLGQIVMAVSQDVGSILMRPIAVVSIGGLLYATLMTLFVVPCIYDMMNKKQLRKIDDKDLEMLDL
ncbi:MAG: efflux RND transporter permease subunit [Oscillospiraceae bacterium]|nr:efflux RND transporter permease subunit [Oscillospiraceae bacterium]